MTEATMRKIPEPDVGATANKLQADATKPDATIWVGASAGSGKTKVLSERVLRLLLPEGTRAGADPSKILCITFTKAAASEVLERIMRYLREWAICPSEKLRDGLTKLLGRPPVKEQEEAARALFARVLETAGGMKILTIHAFCQSVLARFPMEAELPAGFEVMEEAEAKAVMTSVRHALITQLQTAPENDKLRQAFDYLSSAKNADDIEKLLTSLASERGRLFALRTKFGSTDSLCDAVYAYLNADKNSSRNELIQKFLQNIPAADLRAILPKLEACKTGTNKENLALLDPFLAAADDMRLAMFTDYRLVFLKKTDGLPAKLVGTLRNDDFAIRTFGTESERLMRLDAALADLATATATASLLRFALAALDAYETEKRNRNRLDFEDLIDRTKRLLGAGGVHWVQYKLDGGIDHVLVDEAQDTNPDQWDIVTALTDEFYDGSSARESATRTTFVVGDEKQSIFSFQRADPRVFDSMRARLEKRTTEAQAKFDDIPMRISFRSAPSILNVVDAVFADAAMRAGVVRGSEDMEHAAFHSGKAGRVEIWPELVRKQAKDREAWLLPEYAEREENPVTALAEKTAQTIRRMLDDPKAMLESKGRRIRAGDIMILLAKRKPMADALLKALRKHDIPVSGIDRMVVTKQIAVMDALAAMAFALQPLDDLNLATLLKSPFVGLYDDALFGLCHNRPASLFDSLKSRADMTRVTTWLDELHASAKTKTAAAFLHDLLYGPCPADAQSGIRALMSRLGADIRDPLQEILARADSHDMSDARGLQGFLEDARNDEGEIKRQMSEDGNFVRMMTVHGSKGLEAPIVFMPDTIRSNNAKSKTDPILWPDRDDPQGLPLWSPNSESRAEACERRVAEARTRSDEEYRRLLYVALTRAADRLYIGGADKNKKGGDKEGSWYHRIRNAFAQGRVANVTTDEDGTMWVANPQTDTPKRDNDKAGIIEATKTIPDWVRKTAPVPEYPPRPLAPSKPEGDEPAALSPLFGDTTWRFRRGRIIHTLFQFLPELPQDTRRERAAEWLARPAHDLDATARAEILESVMAVLEDAAFAPLFGPDARAEVPLTGLLTPTHIVSGQIDRLLVTPDEVLVLDYKTNRPAPRDVAGVPDAYKRQMRTYRDLLRKIWPERPVRCALLWTDGPRLMDLTDVL